MRIALEKPNPSRPCNLTFLMASMAMPSVWGSEHHAEGSRGLVTAWDSLFAREEKMGSMEAWDPAFQLRAVDAYPQGGYLPHTACKRLTTFSLNGNLGLAF